MTNPDQYAVMGNPIAHSKSPQIHTLFAQQTGQRLTYGAILVEVGHFAEAVQRFRDAGGKGLNVTVPFKQDAWALTQARSARAESAGAVNTLAFRDDGVLFGDNTDGEGLVRDLQVNHGFALGGKRILILGAGGAVRGVLGPILAQRPARVFIANRTAARAGELVELFTTRGVAGGGTLAGGGFGDVPEEGFDLVLNGTAASLKGDIPPIPPQSVAGAWCYDMMYGAAPTAFLRWAAEHNAVHCLDGLGMLVEQAAESFLLWRGVRPETGPVIAAIRATLKS